MALKKDKHLKGAKTDLLNCKYGPLVYEEGSKTFKYKPMNEKEERRLQKVDPCHCKLCEKRRAYRADPLGKDLDQSKIDRRIKASKNGVSMARVEFSVQRYKQAFR